MSTTPHGNRQATEAPRDDGDLDDLIQSTGRMAINGTDPNPIETFCFGRELGGGQAEYSCTFPREPDLDTTHEIAATVPRSFWLAAQEAITIAEEIDPNRKRRLRIKARDGNMINTMNDYVHKWAAKGWRRKGEPIKNLDLIRLIFDHPRRPDIDWIKI